MNEITQNMIDAAPHMLAALEEIVAEFDTMNDRTMNGPDSCFWPDTGGIALARTVIDAAKNI